MKFLPEKCTVIRSYTKRRRIFNTSYQIHAHSLEVVDSPHHQRRPHLEKAHWEHGQQGQQNMGICPAKRQWLHRSSEICCLFNYGTTSARVLLHSLGSSLWKRNPCPQRRAATFEHQNYSERTPRCVTNMIQSQGWESLQLRCFADRLTICFSKSSMG